MNYLLLDVDGVLNALSAKPPTHNTGWTGRWESERVLGYRIFWSTELIDELNDLNSRDDFEIVVLSTWRTLATEHLFSVIGLNVPEDITVLDPEGTGHGYETVNYTPSKLKDGEWWKLVEAREFIKDHPDDRIFWADDDMFRYKYSASVYQLESEHPNLHLYCPSTNHGLTKKHIEDIKSFMV